MAFEPEMQFDAQLAHLQNAYRLYTSVHPFNEDYGSGPLTDAFVDNLDQVSDGITAAIRGTYADILNLGREEYLRQNLHTADLRKDSVGQFTARVATLAVMTGLLEEPNRVYRRDYFANLFGGIKHNRTISTGPHWVEYPPNTTDPVKINPERPIYATIDPPDLPLQRLYFQYGHGEEPEAVGSSQIAAINLRKIFPRVATVMHPADER